ncbi:MAG: response regulator [Desulfuromonadales bacterium]
MSHKIMVVDDSPFLRQIVKFTLQGAGFEVLEAVDGLDALRKLTYECVHLLIADINMPNIDGMELLRELRKSKEGLPVLLLSSESDPGLQEKGLAAGAAAWLVKPVQPEQLVMQVKSLLE